MFTYIDGAKIKETKTLFAKICKAYGFDRDLVLATLQEEFNKKFSVDGEIIPKKVRHLIEDKKLNLTSSAPAKEEAKFEDDFADEELDEESDKVSF